MLASATQKDSAPRVRLRFSSLSVQVDVVVVAVVTVVVVAVVVVSDVVVVDVAMQHLTGQPRLICVSAAHMSMVTYLHSSASGPSQDAVVVAVIVVPVVVVTVVVAVAVVVVAVVVVAVVVVVVAVVVEDVDSQQKRVHALLTSSSWQTLTSAASPGPAG